VQITFRKEAALGPGSSLSRSSALSFCLATPKIWQDLPSLSSSIPVSAGVDILVASVSEQVVFVDFLAAPARLCEYVAMFCVAVFVALVVAVLDFEYMLRVAFTYCEHHTHTLTAKWGSPVLWATVERRKISTD